MTHFLFSIFFLSLLIIFFALARLTVRYPFNHCTLAPQPEQVVIFSLGGLTAAAVALDAAQVGLTSLDPLVRPAFISALALVLLWMFSSHNFSTKRLMAPIVSFAFTYSFLSLRLALRAHPDLQIDYISNLDIFVYWNFSTIYLFGNSINPVDVGLTALANIGGIDFRQLESFTQAPAAYAIIAWHRLIFNTPGDISLSHTLIFVVSACAYILTDLFQKSFKLNNLVAVTIIILPLTSGFSQYLTGNYFFAQWLGFLCFIFLLHDGLVGSQGSILWRMIVCAFAYYLITMSYQVLLVPSLLIHFLSTLLSGYVRTTRNLKALWHPATLTKIIVGQIRLYLPVGLIYCVLMLLDLGGALSALVQTNSIVATNTRGWPLSLIPPIAFFLPHSPFDLQFNQPPDAMYSSINMWQSFIYFAFSLILIGYFLSDGILKERILPRHFICAIAALFCISYIFLFFTTEGSYRAWKFAGSFVLPLFPSAILAVFAKNLSFFSLQWQFKQALSILGIVFCFATFFHWKNYAYGPEAVDAGAPLMVLSDIDIGSVEAVIVHFNNDRGFLPAMLTVAAWSASRVVLMSPSIYLADSPDFSEFPDSRLRSEISPQTPMLTNQLCDSGFYSEETSLSDGYCLVSRFGDIPDHFGLDFSKFDTSLFSISGLNPIETNGRWSSGTHPAKFSFPIDTDWEFVHISIAVTPFSTGFGDCREFDVFVEASAIHSGEVCETNLLSHIDFMLHSDVCSFGICHFTLSVRNPMSPATIGIPDPRLLGLFYRSIKIYGSD